MGFPWNISLIIGANTDHGELQNGGYIEVVDAWDEYQIDGNVEGFREAVEKARALPHYSSVRVVDVRIPYDEVEKLFLTPAATFDSDITEAK